MRLWLIICIRIFFFELVHVDHQSDTALVDKENTVGIIIRMVEHLPRLQVDWLKQVNYRLFEPRALVFEELNRFHDVSMRFLNHFVLQVPREVDHNFL